MQTRVNMRLRAYSILTVLIIASGLVLRPCEAFAQQMSVHDQIMADHGKAGGVYFVGKQFSSVSEGNDRKPLTKAPKGYKAFYISHYGRHGARYLYKEEQNEKVVGLLSKAHESGVLTPYGEDVFNRVMAHYEKTRYREGDLTELGWLQHETIAKEIWRSYPAVFKARPHIDAKSTMIQRCIMSMNAFCGGLKAMDPKLPITQTASRAYLDELNPHAPENPYYQKPEMEAGRSKRLDPWGGTLKEYTKAKVDIDGICSRIFADKAWLKENRSPMSFCTDLYNFVLNMQDSDTGVDLMDVFTDEDLWALWQVDNYMYFVESGPTSSRDIPALEAIIKAADEAVTAGKPAVRLRFGHDSVTCSLLSYIGANGWNEIPVDADHIAQQWQNFQVPMAATIVMAFYKSSKDEDPVLMKVTLNGEEVSLPLESVSGPYYKWEDFKAMCEKVIEEKKEK